MRIKRGLCSKNCGTQARKPFDVQEKDEALNRQFSSSSGLMVPTHTENSDDAKGD
jgi:hypothetical protein